MRGQYQLSQNIHSEVIIAEQLAEVHKEIVGRIYTISNGTFFKGSSVLGLYKFKKVTWGVGILHNYFLLIRGEFVGL